jgi:hypothetical protein
MRGGTPASDTGAPPGLSKPDGFECEFLREVLQTRFVQLADLEPAGRSCWQTSGASSPEQRETALAKRLPKVPAKAGLCP